MNTRLETIIFHIDVNAAFLSWEAVYRLYHKGAAVDLREIPSAVAGDAGMRRGIVLAKSMPAKRCGIKTGESIPEAKRKCPKLTLAPPNYNLYERCSAALMAILREYSDVVEQYSIDEAFVDMTQTCHLFGEPEQAAEMMKNRIYRELGFTVNVGVSENKLLAKMASDFRKPDRVHTLWKEEIQKKMWPLAVPELFFVGRATAQRLFSVGIRTIGELAQADPAYMKRILKKQGEIVWAFANGLDFSPVLKQAPANKGYGNSTTIPFDVTDAPTAKKVLLALSETVAARLRADGVQISVIAVGIKSADFSYQSHQRVLTFSTNITLEIYQTACALFDELWDKRPIRHLGVHTSGVCRENFSRQMSLFDGQDYEKLARLDLAVDAVRERFGADALMRAAFLNQPINHMSGGISRE